MAKSRFIPVSERRYSVNELLNADEIIVTSSSKLAQGVKSIGDISVGGKDEKTLALLKNAIYDSYLKATS